ncbi:hypothetical protein [Collinsella tanakaei]|uniref:hypothetical protein n=1 Tax=Collinsella tanakaei TaxID=626935 RepID=UPI001F18B25D|nr:hypothetical protein [Collinsella tanakaei]MCF2620990.1 hypothetical protein [Collinsella tanakaei]MDM8301098.1 hypothetical protein [Collinsella tanakaei]
MLAFLSALAPELDYDTIHAAPSSLKAWTADGGPRSKVAAFVVDGSAPVLPGTARELLHRGGAMTCVSLRAFEGVC